MVRVKRWLMHYSNDGPHKDRSTGMFVCVCVCVTNFGILL